MRNTGELIEHFMCHVYDQANRDRHEYGCLWAVLRLARRGSARLRTKASACSKHLCRFDSTPVSKTVQVASRASQCV